MREHTRPTPLGFYCFNNNMLLIPLNQKQKIKLLNIMWYKFRIDWGISLFYGKQKLSILRVVPQKQSKSISNSFPQLGIKIIYIWKLVLGSGFIIFTNLWPYISHFLLKLNFLKVIQITKYWFHFKASSIYDTKLMKKGSISSSSSKLGNSRSAPIL